MSRKCILPFVTVTSRTSIEKEIEFFIDHYREKFRLETAVLGTGFLRMSKKTCGSSAACTIGLRLWSL